MDKQELFEESELRNSDVGRSCGLQTLQVS